MTDLLTRYHNSQTSVAELARRAGLPLSALAPLEAALPGDPLELPASVAEALDRALTRPVAKPKPKPRPKKHVTNTLAKPKAARHKALLRLRGGRKPEIAQIAPALYGDDLPAHQKLTRRCLYAMRDAGLARRIGDRPPYRWMLTDLGERAAAKLDTEINP